jgi:HSP20 family protein
MGLYEEMVMARGFLAPLGLGHQGADPFSLLRREMEQLFDDIGGTPSGGGGAGLVMSPRMDVVEDDKELRITAEMTGVAPDNVEVTVDDDLLTIRGTREVEQRTERKNCHLIERIQGGFQRTLRLPYPADPSQVQARFDHGVLTVTLSKSGIKQGAQRIEVSRGTSQVGASASESGDPKPH